MLSVLINVFILSVVEVPRYFAGHKMGKISDENGGLIALGV